MEPTHPVSPESLRGVSEEVALVHAARAGDPTAQAELYRLYVRRVAGLSHRLLAGGPDVDDLVQDVFMEAFSHLGALAAPEAFGTWLGAITIRTAHKRARRSRLSMRLGLARDVPHEVEHLAAPVVPPEMAIDLRTMMMALIAGPAGAAEALVLRHFEGLQLDEIATRMGLSLATVKRRIESAEAWLEIVRARDLP